MSDNSFTPGEHPAFPPAPTATPPPAAIPGAPPPYPGAPALSHPHYQTPPYAPPRPTSGLAVTSLITGIAGIALSWTFVVLLASVAAVITGHMALKQTRDNTALGGRGMAIAGLILGYVGVAILAFSIVIGIVSLMFIGGIGFLPFFLV